MNRFACLACTALLVQLAGCNLLPGQQKDVPPPPVVSTSGSGTITQDGVATDYKVDPEQSSLLLLVLKHDAAACRIFHHHAVSSLATEYSFALDRSNPGASHLTARVAAAGLDPDQAAYRDSFDATRGTRMTDSERSDIRSNVLTQVDAANHPVLVFAAHNLSTLEGAGTADVFVTLRGSESVSPVTATATWSGTTLTLDGEGVLEAGQHGIPSGNFSSCIRSSMRLKWHLVLVPGVATGGGIDASVPAFMAQHFPDSRACDSTVAWDDVKPIIDLNCRVCHGEPTQYAAPLTLGSWEDFHADGPLAPGAPLFEDAYERLNADDGRRMPPEPLALTTAEKDLLEAWFSSGAHRYRCDPGGTPLPAGPDPPPLACTTNRTWPDGGPGSALMHPGRDCLDCHANDDGPDVVTLGGTVFPSLHERDDCYGASGADGGAFAGLRVIIKDRTGHEFILPVNSAGNFLYAARAGGRQVQPPYSARVENPRTGETRVMFGEQNIMSCNRCHTGQGSRVDGGVTNPPPGRIVVPGRW